MKKIFVLASLFLFLMSSAALAKPQTYTATGEYVMSPKETLEDGIKHAREDAMRQISESVGVYVESQSEAKNQMLTKDEVKTMSSSIVRVKSESTPTIIQHGAGLDIKLTITAEADTDDLFNKEKEKNEKLTQKNHELEIDSQGKDEEDALDFDQAVEFWLSSFDVKEAKDLLEQSTMSTNPMKKACAYKWLGILDFRVKNYEHGFQLCDKAIQVYEDEQAKNHYMNLTEEVELLAGMADVSASRYKNPDLAEKYLAKISKLNEEHHNRLIDELSQIVIQHVKEAVRDLRNSKEPDMYKNGGYPSILYVLSYAKR